MRTGTKASLTATSCPVRTVRWWCGTTAASGAMYRATTTYPTPAKRVSVSSPDRTAPSLVFKSLVTIFVAKNTSLNSASIQQPPVASPHRFPLLKCLGRSIHVTRPTPRCGTTVKRVLFRNWILSLRACPAANGRSLRLPACHVSAEIDLPPGYIQTFVTVKYYSQI